MTPERWQRIDALLQEAVKRPARERARYLDEFCTDEASRREVESLISFHDQAEDFLEVPAFEQAIVLFADQDDSLVGLTVGPYRIERLLGAGGMGQVYLAEDTKLDRRVAIKFLPADLEADDLARRRLIREAKAAAKLDHPNICATYEVAEDAGRSFIVMQYVEGETLASRVQRNPLGLREAVDVTVQVADALAEAHSHGIIHRDMKPQNVMVTPRGQVKVLDFGLAKMVRGVAQDELPQSSLLSMPGLILGTASYMSPEQAKGAPVDARTDLFSIGVMLYECIAGELPFTGATAMETIAQVIHVNPPPPSRFNRHVTPELERLTLKALAKEPSARYQSAAELVNDLLAVRATLQTEDSVATRAIAPPPRMSAAKALASLPDLFRAPRGVIPVVAALAIGLISLLLLGSFVADRAMPNLAVPSWLRGPSWLRASYHPKLEALHWYNQGTAALRDGLPYKARNAFQHSVQEDGKFALAHARLAEAMTELDLSDANAEIVYAKSLAPDLSVLPKLDALYLQAITNLVAHHYKDAIANYRQIVQSVESDEKSHAYMDLGRIYEKNEQIDEAIESYRIATELAGQDPAAFLRLGILYGRKLDRPAAETAFKKAREIYEAQTNYEGITEVRYQRGVLFKSLSLLDDAQRELQQAYDQALANDNKHQVIRSLLQLSSFYCLKSDTDRAEECATKARALAIESGMESLSTQGLIDLGNTYLNGGSYDQAEKYLAQAIDDAQQHREGRNEANARHLLANLYSQRHEPDKAVPQVVQAIEFYEKGGYRKESSSARILLARLNSLRGDYDAALSIYQEMLQAAETTEDQVLRARLHADIGNTLNLMERYQEALDHLNVSIEAFKSMKLDQKAAYALADLGDALWRLGHYDQAREALDQASRLAGKNKPLLGKISLITANLLLSERRFADAAAKATEALELNAHVEPESNARYTLGLAEALSGQSKGIQTCRHAVDTATSYNDVQLLPSAQLALAEAMLKRGDAVEALSTALQAQQKFAAAGRRESEWRAWLAAGLASQKAGDVTMAYKYLKNAEGLLASIAQVSNDYVTRPDVQNCVQHLRQALYQTR